jgi:hypothetical protein
MVTAPFRGASGKRYVYSLLPDNQEMGVPQQGGVLIFAAGTFLVPEPVYVAAVKNLRGMVQEMAVMREARESHGATLLYLHLDPHSDFESRLIEAQDLIAAYDPPMNAKTA